MANLLWLGKALARVEIHTLTVSGTWVAGDTISLSIPTLTTGKTIVLTIGTNVSLAAVCAAIVAAWNSESDSLGTGYTVTERGINVPEFAEITASAASPVVTLTHKTAGVPFTVAVTKTTAGSGDIVAATATAATGPNHWDDATNWDGGTVPANGDSAYLASSKVPVKYGLAQTAVTLALLQADMSYETDIGLPPVNEGGDEYIEYRPRKLAIKATALVLGRGDGSGGQWRLDNSTAQTTAIIENSGNSSEDNLPAIQWVGTHASNALTVRGQASFGAAVLPTEVATIATLTVEGEATVVTGLGVTLSGAVTVLGSGVLTAYSALAGSLTLRGAGVAVVNGTGAVAQLTAHDQSAVFYNSTGTLGGATVLNGDSVLSFDGDPRPKTVSSAIDIFGSPRAAVLDGFKVVNSGGSLILDWNGVAPDVSGIGTDCRITRAATA